MKKKLLALLLCMVMVLGTLAGCNGNKDDNEANNNVNNEVDANENENNEDESGENEGETGEGESEDENEGSNEDESDDTEDESGESDSNSGSNEDANNGSNSGSNEDANSGSNSGSSDSNSGSNSGSSNSGSAEATPTEETYTVTVTSEAGQKLSGVEVSIYEGSKRLDKANTNSDGKVEFKLMNDGTYTIKVDKLPAGHHVSDSYSFSGKAASIVTDIQLRQNDISTTTFKIGDVMCDFTLTTIKRETITLSEILKEKDLVVINFWYAACTYCNQEVPYLSEAYEMYKDDMEIIAVNNIDAPADIARSEHFANAPFKVAQCPSSWVDAFNVAYYPYSILIDRYGVICEIIPGAYMETEKFTSIFSPYLGDNYTQVLHP